MENNYTFENLIDVERWRKIQLHFSDVVGVSLATIDSQGRFLLPPTGKFKICEEFLNRSSSSLKLKTCFSCPLSFLKEISSDWKKPSVCPLGLNFFFIPGKIKEEVLVYIVVGPLILGSRDFKYFSSKASQFNLEEELLRDLLRETKVFSFGTIDSFLELLYNIFSYFLQLGYDRLKLKEIIPEFPQVDKKIHRFYVDKLLNSFLDTSSRFSGADIGSIMVFDEERGELYIKIARGLDTQIVRKTHLKLGEGLAGLVAQRREPLFIEEDTQDEILKGRLRRPEIKSSLIAPLKVKDRLFGVLNLATLRVNPEFTSQILNTLEILIDLIEGTLAVPVVEESI